MGGRLQDWPIEVELERATLGPVEPLLIGDQERDHDGRASDDLVLLAIAALKANERYQTGQAVLYPDAHH